MKTILTLFGTRPEIIKLSPVIRALEARPSWRSLNVSSSQHTDLLRPFARQLNIRIDHDLDVMTAGQTPADVLGKVVMGMGRLLAAERPDIVLVQGDTTTAIAGALAAFYGRVPVGHVEAGLRTGDLFSPFPEEANRRLIGRIVDIHFAATEQNVRTLTAEGVPAEQIVLTGNPVVDAVTHIMATSSPGAELAQILDGLNGRKLLVLTTHRRENFGEVMSSHLRAIRRVVDRHPDLVVVFPVHPNPAVRAVTGVELSGADRIHCVEPMGYSDFVHLLSNAWLIASDSGGVQEEAPSLGKPVLILRDTTERPEVIDCGIGRLVGHSGERLEAMLEEAIADDSWIRAAETARNPFGSGDAGERIARALESVLGEPGGAS